MSRNPASILFTVSGVELAVDDGQSATTSGLQGITVLGSDGTDLHFLKTTSDGSLKIDPVGTTAQPVTDNGGSLTIDSAQLPASLVGGRLDENIGAWLGSTSPTVGQKTMSASIPMVLANDHTAIPITVGTYVPSSSTTMQNAATSTGAGTALPVTGYTTAVLTITGTFVANIIIEATADGTNWNRVRITKVGSPEVDSHIDTIGLFRLSVTGFTQIRARIIEYTSGSITVVGLATNDSFTRLSTEIDFQNTHVDAFHRLRVSSPTTLFDGKTLYDSQDLHFTESFVTGGSAAMVSNQPIRRLTVNTTNAASAIRQTKRYFSYQSGKSQQIFQTFTFGSAVTNVRRRAGYFDANNGIFLEQTSSGVSLIKRTSVSGSPVDTSVSQASWNLDALDGTGPSGLTLDLSKTQILVIDFQWLGGGEVRVGFGIGDTIVYVHIFQWANLGTGVYTATPSLPVRWEITNTNTSAGANLDCICCSVATEAGTTYPGVLTSIDRGTNLQSFSNGDGTNLRPILSVRAQSAFTRITAVPEEISVLCTTSSLNGFRWALILNPTITGGTAASWTTVTNSGLEYDIAQTGTVSGGYQVASGYGLGSVLANVRSEGILSLGATIDGTRDIYVLAVAQLNAATESYVGQVQFREQI